MFNFFTWAWFTFLPNLLIVFLLQKLFNKYYERFFAYECDRATTRRSKANKDPKRTETPTASLVSEKVAFTYSYEVNRKGQMIYNCCWAPKPITEAKAVIVLCHGYCNYLGGYTYDLAQDLANHGYVVFGIEYYGHGRSDGLHGKVDSFEDIASDVIRFSQKLWTNSLVLDSMPVFILGISMGATVAMQMMLQASKHYKRKIEGVILVCPLLDLAPQLYPPVWKMVLFRSLCALLRNCPIITNGSDLYAYTCQHPKYMERVTKNPMFYKGDMRVKTLISMDKTFEYINSNMHQFDHPLLILQGDGDRLVSLKQIQKFMKCNKSTDKTLKIFENAWHYLFMEPCAADVYTTLFEWVDQRCTSSRYKSLASQESSCSSESLSSKPTHGVNNGTSDAFEKQRSDSLSMQSSASSDEFVHSREASHSSSHAVDAKYDELANVVNNAERRSVEANVN